MENPTLSFLSLTILSDSSSEGFFSVLVHELAHSWSGNLVTNETWNDFWLNEGFTTYLTSRNLELLEGQESYRIEEALLLKNYELQIPIISKKLMSLKIKENSFSSPEEAYTLVPYVKGSFFLKFLEKKIWSKKF